MIHLPSCRFFAQLVGTRAWPCFSLKAQTSAKRSSQSASKGEFAARLNPTRLGVFVSGAAAFLRRVVRRLAFIFGLERSLDAESLAGMGIGSACNESHAHGQ